MSNISDENFSGIYVKYGTQISSEFFHDYASFNNYPGVKNVNIKFQELTRGS